MRMYLRVLASTGVVLALGVCVLSLTNNGRADGEKEAAEGVLKLSDAVSKGDAEAVKKQTADLQKMDLLPVMTVFKKRDATPPGLGFGPKGAYPPESDGIEAKIMGLAKKELSKDDAKKQADDIKKAAEITQAVAEVAAGKCPVKKKEGDKDPKDWAKWTDDMKKSAKDLADAAKKGDTKGIKDAASKLNASCNNCHGPFRDS